MKQQYFFLNTLNICGSEKYIIMYYTLKFECSTTFNQHNQVYAIVYLWLKNGLILRLFNFIFISMCPTSHFAALLLLQIVFFKAPVLELFILMIKI